MVKKYNVVSIYSGAGGLDIGFEREKYNILYSTDYWEPACETLRKNKISGLVECKDIRKINFKKILKKRGNPHVDVLVGGPPCPPFSKSRFYLKDKKRALEDSEGSYTISEYFRAVQKKDPTVCLFEKVQAYNFMPQPDVRDFLKKKRDELEYTIIFKVLNSENYGGPQK